MPRRPSNPRLANIEDWRDGADADPGFVTALARGLEILRAFGRDDRYLGNGELAKRTGIPKSTVSRLTQTLTSLGYLRYVDQLERYQLGPGVLALGYRYLAGNGVRDIAHPHMQALADSTDCSVALGAGDGSFKALDPLGRLFDGTWSAVDDQGAKLKLRPGVEAASPAASVAALARSRSAPATARRWSMSTSARAAGR